MKDRVNQRSRFKAIAESDNFIVEYDFINKIYRVSYFEDNHYVDQIIFYSYETTNLEDNP